MSRKINILTLGMLMYSEALSALDEGIPYNSKTPLNPEDIDVKPAKKVIPPGCKEYYFDLENDGKCFENLKDIKGLLYFKTIAISKKSAIRKYKKWLLR